MGRRRPQGAVTRLCVSPLLGHPLRGLALRARGIRVEDSDKNDIEILGTDPTEVAILLDLIVSPPSRAPDS